jgi:two-component system chemotaxis response regulator CheB
VLIVDDSPTARAVLARKLAADPGLVVVGKAIDGVEALEQAAQLQPDVITLDIEMPRLNGLQTLERLMRERPTPVVMVSSLTKQGAEATLAALELGAVDFIEKPTRHGVIVGTAVSDELCEKVRQAAHARLRRPGAVTSAVPARPPVAGGGWGRKTVVIASSTGGPQAVRTVLTALPADFAVPVVVVQHMPAGFTRSYAERLNELGPLRVAEARPGDTLEPGRVLLAPGGSHLVFDAKGVATLTQGELECGVRPAANITMESIAAARGFATVGVVLTGMGHDGTRGAGLIRAAGGYIIAEAEETCVVYGMPRSVAQAGYANEVVPLHGIAAAIVQRCQVPARLAS